MRGEEILWWDSWDMSLPNFIEKSEAEVLSPLLEGWELVVVQDLGDDASCCSWEH